MAEAFLDLYIGHYQSYCQCWKLVVGLMHHLLPTHSAGVAVVSGLLVGARALIGHGCRQG